MGLDPERFWRSTPRQIEASFKASERRLAREHNERAWLAWHGAALGRSKKMPPLRDLLARTRGAERKGWQQQLAALQAWVVASGGTIVHRRKD
jgi:hypothetical protein